MAATGVDADPDPPPLFFLFLDDPPFEPSDLVLVPLLLPLFSVDEGPPCDDVGVGACEGVVCADDGAGESYTITIKKGQPPPIKKCKNEYDIPS